MYSEKGVLPVLRGENVTIGNLRWDTKKFWNHSVDELEQYFLRINDVVIGMDGSRVGKNRASIKESDLPLILAQRVARLRVKNGYSQKLLKYLILGKSFVEYVDAIHTGTSIPHISSKQIADFEVQLPISFDEQEQIAEVLSSLDDKIDLLHRQNHTLEQMAETLFRQWFVEGAEDDWLETTLSHVYKISIGRTPPRKESEWFTTPPIGYKWVSIKDMGAPGVYILSTSEHLTNEAVDRFKVPVVPKNTVILSFKLTVGRVCITGEDLVTNEAIASFVPLSDKSPGSEFLYLFLKQYNYQQLGSTSSIAEAINSQTIKDIVISIPPMKNVQQFTQHVEQFFKKIHKNQLQIKLLEKTRDSLLPKLMSGAVRVNN